MAADTNILVRATTEDDARQARLAQDLLREAEMVAVSSQVLCELVWVLSRAFKVPTPSIASGIRGLIGNEKVVVDRPAVEAGLAMLDEGGDFADGVIAYQGRWLGADEFVSFDRHAVSLLKEQTPAGPLAGRLTRSRVADRPRPARVCVAGRTQGNPLVITPPRFGFRAVTERCSLASATLHTVAAVMPGYALDDGSDPGGFSHVTLRHRLAGSVAILALAQAYPAGSALAQLAPVQSQTSSATAPTGADAATATGSTAENIVVTGSRLKASNATSESPVVVVTSAQIAHSSAQTLEDVLTRLPEIGTSGVYATTNNGGSGSSCIDIRNLGVERTLVLVDGKRFVQSAGGITCVDLNNIPLDLVDRIEVLKDGASTTYGADAVAGVVNIILKHNFSGVVFHANGSIATDAGDDKQGEISATAGTTFDHGNFTVSAEYLNRGPVAQADRDWALNPLQGNAKGVVNQRNSFYTPNGAILTDTNNINPDTFNRINNPNGNFDGSLLNKSGTAFFPNVAPDNPANYQGYDFGADQVPTGQSRKGKPD